MDVLSPFIPVLCHSDLLFYGESCPCLDVVHPGRAWPSSPSFSWHCSLHYLFLKATPLFPHGVTIVCYSFLALTVSNSSLFTPALLRTHSFVFFAVHETRNILISPFISKASRRVSSFLATYGCESWTLRKNEETRLDAFEMKGLRRMLRDLGWSPAKIEFGAFYL